MPVPQMVATTVQEVVAEHPAGLQVLTVHQEVAPVMLITSVAETQSQLLVYAFPE